MTSAPHQHDDNTKQPTTRNIKSNNEEDAQTVREGVKLATRALAEITIAKLTDGLAKRYHLEDIRLSDGNASEIAVYNHELELRKYGNQVKDDFRKLVKGKVMVREGLTTSLVSYLLQDDVFEQSTSYVKKLISQQDTYLKSTLEYQCNDWMTRDWTKDAVATVGGKVIAASRSSLRPSLTHLLSGKVISEPVTRSMVDALSSTQVTLDNVMINSVESMLKDSVWKEHASKLAQDYIKTNFDILSQSSSSNDGTENEPS